PEPPQPAPGLWDSPVDAALLKATTGEFSLESILLLRLRGRGIAHLGCLADCSNLEWLDLSDNAIAGLAPLATLRALAVLNLAGNRVASVEPLRGCRSLRQLNLGLRHLESNPAVRAPTAPRWPPLLPGLKAIDGSAGWPRAALRLLRELDAALDATPRLPRPRSRRSRWVQAGFWEHGRRGRSAVLEEATAGSCFAGEAAAAAGTAVGPQARVHGLVPAQVSLGAEAAATAGTGVRPGA
uniref:Leucine rich repeat containing 61 n=1 Tax=Malurus cyaneus samueli TaxID=2593467 RepID=A0A8C5TN46_9PASS